MKKYYNTPPLYRKWWNKGPLFVAPKRISRRINARITKKWHWPICNVTDCNGKIMPGISGIRPEQICIEVQFKKERTCNRRDCNRSGFFPRKIEIFAYLVSVQKNLWNTFWFLHGMVCITLHNFSSPNVDDKCQARQKLVLWNAWGIAENIKTYFLTAGMEPMCRWF